MVLMRYALEELPPTKRLELTFDTRFYLVGVWPRYFGLAVGLALTENLSHLKFVFCKVCGIWYGVVALSSALEEEGHAFVKPPGRPSCQPCCAPCPPRKCTPNCAESP